MVTPRFRAAPKQTAVAAVGTFVKGKGPYRPRYGSYPSRNRDVGRSAALGVTPALGGMELAGRVLGVNKIQTIATLVRRG